MAITVVNGQEIEIESPPWAGRLHELLGMMNGLSQGSDETLRALRQEADAIGAPVLLVGGIAVIRHGYTRTTDDRDALVSYRHAPALAERLMDHDDWDRLEGIPVIGLHDLIFFKLLAGRMRDLADIMELCKRHLPEIDANKVFARLESDDETLREKFLEILKQAPKELENERRFGGGD